MTVRRAQAWLGLFIAIAVAGCRDEGLPTSSHRNNSVTPVRSEGRALHIGMDARFAALADSIPGFAGYYYDKAGKVTVRLTDRVQEMRARAVLGRWLPAAAIGAIQTAEYTFPQLLAWKDSVSAHILGMPGVTSSDADEVRNRVVIGVENIGLRGQVAAALAHYSIPASAVIVEESGPTTLLTTLQDHVRPVPGGMQLDRTPATPLTEIHYVCTLGYNVWLNQDTSVVYGLTNSHCTNTPGGVESTKFWQNLSFQWPTEIGTEVWDPAYAAGPFGDAFSNGICPSDKFCRYSDAALFQYASRSTAHFGRIANVTSGVSIDPSNPLVIRGIGGEPRAVGNSISKIGIATGLTTGEVTATCVDAAGENDRYIMCSTEANASGLPGDSGGPVFFTNSTVGTKAIGIIWGKSEVTGGLFFSEFENIMRDMAPGMSFQVYRASECTSGC